MSTDLFNSILTGLEEAIEHAEGKKKLSTQRRKVKVIPLPDYKAEDIKEIRMKVDMTQRVFADFMGVSVKTVEAWEAGKNEPSGPAKRVLSLIISNPGLPEEYEIVVR